MTERYPLSWPPLWKRGPRGGRLAGRFHRYGKWLTVSDGLARLGLELGRIEAKEVIVSSNVELGARGLPLSGQKEPGDRGVAVYFKLHGKDRVLACDTFTTVADNMAAIAAHIEAMRKTDRYGVGTLDQAFAGYDALPAPGANNRAPWRKVLGVADDAPLSATDIEATYRALARELHPDSPGGSHDAMAELNRAIGEARAELGA